MRSEDFNQFRGEALEYMHNRNKELIERWCKNCGVTSPIGYYNDLSDGIMTIYTTQPGYLIGRQGTKLDAFVSELEREFNRKYEVKLIEIRGGFVNLKEE